MKIETTKKTIHLWKIKDLPRGTFFRLFDSTDGFCFRGDKEYAWFGGDGTRPQVYSIEGVRNDECAIVIPHDTITVSFPV